MKILNDIKENLRESGTAFAALLTALVLTGGFSEFTSCVIAVAVSVMLIAVIIRSGGLRIQLDLTSASVILAALFYLISSFYAVDGGMALLGFIKFLPVVLFMLLLMQKSSYTKGLTELLPYTALALGLISLVLMWLNVPGFSVDGRMAGFFQYPNTFAMFLLIGELLALEKCRENRILIAVAAILFVMILLTQSRAVFVLAVISTLIALFVLFSKKARVILLIAVAAAAVTVWLLYPVLKENEFIGRFFSLSVFESTFAGRLLYWSDALPLILRHPFGAGYLGYYYLEQSIQTGVYSVRYIHNDIIQLLLDIGWLPTLGILAAIFRPVFSRRNSFFRKLIIVTFFLHICFDFDLQYTAMWFILLLLLADEKGESKSRAFTLRKGAPAAVISVCSAVFIYFSIALGLGFCGSHQASLSMYPLNTEERIAVLTQTEDPDEMNDLADTIRRQNEYVQLAYSAKARYLFGKGDVKNMMKYKNKVFEIAPFDYDEYEEYASMLIYCADLYEQSGNSESAELCRKELIETKDKLTSLNDRLSYWGRIIKDQPCTKMPDEIESYIENIEG